MHDDAGSAGLPGSDLLPAPGGAWSALLFDNPQLGLAPQLTWGFTFPYGDVERDYGRTPVTLDLEWIPLATPSWRELSGQTARSTSFGRPGEASVYFFDHHRYDRIELDILDQQGEMVFARVTVSGDLYRLGIETITGESWLRFNGITVAPSDARTGDLA